MNYNDLRKEIERQCNKYRRLYYFITTSDTLVINWHLIDQDRLRRILEKGGLDELKSYLEEIEPMKDWSIRRLREYAQNLAITNYSRLQRRELLQAIKSEEERINSFHRAANSPVQRTPEDEDIEVCSTGLRVPVSSSCDEQPDEGLPTGCVRVVEEDRDDDLATIPTAVQQEGTSTMGTQ